MARMDLETAIRLSAEVKGGGNIDRVKKSLQDLGKSSQVSGRQIDKLYTETQKLSAASNGSVNALNQQKTALEALQRSVDPASRRFALLSQDIAKVSASLKEADAVAAGFSLASALTTSTAAASAGMVSFGGFTASTQSVAAALSRMGVSGSRASEMLRSLQGDTSGTVVTTQRLNQALNQAFASTPERAAAQISTMRQALAQLKIGSEDYLKTLVRVNEAEAVNQARSGRAAVIAASRAYAGPTMTSGYGSNERLPALPNTMAADMQRVSELTARVNNLDRATDEYRRSLQELEVVQRRLSSEPARRRLGLREAAGSAAGVFAMGGGPMGAIGAVGGSLAATGGAAGLAASAGVAATAALTAQSVGAAKALEDQARRLRVMSENGDVLQKQIISLTRNQGYLANSTEASAAAYDILQAGFSKNADILTILKAATLGAVGGFTDITTVADATTSILNGYGLSASNAAMVVDQMKAATDDGKISMEAYAQSIGRVVPSAAAAKLPLEQVNAAISALTAQGVPVETTFSGINQLIKTILKPTKEASELSAELGLQFNAQALAAKGLGGFLADVAAKTGKSSDALSILFSDIDGYKAVVGLLNDDLRRFNQFTDNQARALGRAGTAAEIAVDPLKRFNNALNDIATTLGGLMQPAINEFINSATSKMSSVPAQIENVGLAFKYVSDQLAPVINGLRQIEWYFKNLTPPGWAMQMIGLSGRIGSGLIQNLADQQRQQQRNSFVGPSAPQAFGPAVPARLQGTAAVPLSVVPANVQAAIAAATGAAGAGAAAGAGGRAAAAPRFELSSRGRALVAAAQKLGVSPLDLATIISFETAGTFSPSIRGGAGGNYQGLIQFGPPERRQYGVTPGQSFEEQVMGPVVRYFQDRFKGVGMSTQGASLLDLYTTVLAGNPRANRNARDSFGTSAVSGVQRMGAHRQKALSTFFGGSMENIGFGAVEQAQAQVAGYEESMAAMEQLREQQAAAQKQLEQFNEERAKTAVQLNNEEDLLRATTDEAKRRLEFEIEIDNITQQHLEKLQSLKAIEEEIARLGGVAETAAIREGLEREKEQQLALARLRAEQDLNEILVERQRMMQDLTRQASEPTVFNVLEQQKAQLDEILQKYPAIGQAADAAATLATNGMAEMIAGTKSAKEVFADFLQGIASALIDTAKKMIAQYIAIGIARMFAGIGGSGFGGFAPGGVGGTSPALGFDPSGFAGGTGIPFFANGGIMSPSGPLPLKAYSRGGVASTPQVALFGEGSMNEAYVPLPDGRRIPVALQAPDGNRGDRMRELMGASPAGSNASPVLSMSFETTTLNGVEYVSRDQLESAMAETRKRAANDGAKRGMSMTLDRLQQSPATRSKVGLR